MIGRHQLPVSSPISARGLARGTIAALRGGDAPLASLTTALRERFGADRVVLTDSGTSALVLALRLAVGRGGTVAYPAYGCVDLGAAAEYAGVSVRLYDVDPQTLSPDLGSVEAALERGVGAIVVTHLYGFPADVDAVTTLAERAGVAVIEDAAQGAAGTLAGKTLGSFGPFTVLSFGRGKGLTGGRGGALLAIGRDAAERLQSVTVDTGAGRRGIGELAVAGAQWLLGRPGVYGIPLAIPSLRLGETVYHPAHEPGALAASAAALVGTALSGADAAAVRRRARAAALLREAPRGVRVITSVPGGVSGMLRLPLCITTTAPPVHLGVVPGYPQTLAEQPHLRSILASGEGEHPGAATLRGLLHTVPVHDFVTPRDIEAIRIWLQACDSNH